MNVFSTLVAIFMVDKWGRKVLFLEGGIQMLISEIVVAVVLGILFSSVPAKLSPGVRARFFRACLALPPQREGGSSELITYFYFVVAVKEPLFPRACSHQCAGFQSLLQACWSGPVPRPSALDVWLIPDVTLLAVPTPEVLVTPGQYCFNSATLRQG